MTPEKWRHCHWRARTGVHTHKHTWPFPVICNLWDKSPLAGAEKRGMITLGAGEEGRYWRGGGGVGEPHGGDYVSCVDVRTHMRAYIRARCVTKSELVRERERSGDPRTRSLLNALQPLRSKDGREEEVMFGFLGAGGVERGGGKVVSRSVSGRSRIICFFQVAGD